MKTSDLFYEPKLFKELRSKPEFQGASYETYSRARRLAYMRDIRMFLPFFKRLEIIRSIREYVNRYGRWSIFSL